MSIDMYAAGHALHGGAAYISLSFESLSASIQQPSPRLLHSLPRVQQKWDMAVMAESLRV